MIPMVVPLNGNVTVASNTSYLMKGWSKIYYLTIVRAEIVVTVVNSEPGDHHVLNLLLCSSNLADGNILVSSYVDLTISLLLFC